METKLFLDGIWLRMQWLQPFGIMLHSCAHKGNHTTKHLSDSSRVVTSPVSDLSNQEMPMQRYTVV